MLLHGMVHIYIGTGLVYGFYAEVWHEVKPDWVFNHTRLDQLLVLGLD